KKVSFDYRLKRFTRAAALPPLERHHAYKEIFAADVRAELTGRRRDFDPLAGYRERFMRTEGHELVTRLQDVDFGLYLVDDLLTKTDRASMAWSLEARVPFMDPLVTNFAFSLPVRHKVRGWSKNRLLRRAVEPLLPREVVHGRKRGFSIPAAAWLRGELEPFARETLAPCEAACIANRRARSSHSSSCVRANTFSNANPLPAVPWQMPGPFSMLGGPARQTSSAPASSSSMSRYSAADSTTPAPPWHHC